MIYNRGQISTKSTIVRDFRLENSKEIEGKRDFIVVTDEISKYRKVMRLNGDLADKAFVIENLNAGKKDCRETNVTDLTIKSCAGNIQLRSLNQEDN